MPRIRKTLEQLHAELEQIVPDGFRLTPHGLERDYESERQAERQLEAVEEHMDRFRETFE